MTPEVVSLITAVVCSVWTFAGTNLIFRLVKREGAPPAYMWDGAPLAVRLLWLAVWPAACVFGPLTLLGEVNYGLPLSDTVIQIGLWIWIVGLGSSGVLVVRRKRARRVLPE